MRAATVAVWPLGLKRYTTLARRERTPLGDIDIVAKRGRALVAVEVKARSADRPLRDLITEARWRRICRALALYATRRQFDHLRLRFNVVFLQPRQWLRHILDAWRPS
jgi:putative endonuclease